MVSLALRLLRRVGTPWRPHFGVGLLWGASTTQPRVSIRQSHAILLICSYFSTRKEKISPKNKMQARAVFTAPSLTIVTTA